MGSLKIQDLSRSFTRDDGSKLVVLDHLILDVGDKEFVCVLGSSGCGKTTLLSLIAGLDQDLLSFQASTTKRRCLQIETM